MMESYGHKRGIFRTAAQKERFIEMQLERNGRYLPENIKCPNCGGVMENHKDRYCCISCRYYHEQQ